MRHVHVSRPRCYGLRTILTHGLLEPRLLFGVACVRFQDFTPYPPRQDLGRSGILSTPPSVPAIPLLQCPEIPSSTELLKQAQLSLQEDATMPVLFRVIAAFRERLLIQSS